MTNAEIIKQEIEAINKRNQRVELDKAWETSLTRRVSIALITYILVVLFLFIINAEAPFISAIIPTCGYLLSTLSLSILKNWWIRRNKGS